jgi:hypothetical protein
VIVLWSGEIGVTGGWNGFTKQGRLQGKGREAGELQERDEAANLLVHHTQEDEAKELIDVCPGLPLVEPESRTAIFSSFSLLFGKRIPRSQASKMITSPISWLSSPPE